MSCSSSIISISSHSLDLFRKSTTSPALSVPFTSHFAGVKSSGLKKSIINAGSSWSYSVSEIPTPNSSVLSEDESWGQNGFGKDSLAASESECESKDDNGDVLADGGSDYELALSNLGLPMTIVDSLQSRGITRLLPIQRSVLEPAIEGRDIIARAKTGTGKTLAYGIPIIKRLTEDDPERGSQRRTGKLPRCLVLAPTRELAKQVEKEMKESAPYLTTVCIYEELSYSIQQGVLSRGADVVVGTPGRTMELIKDGALQLGDVQFLVLDEAARMFAFGSEADVEFVLDNLPTKRQIMLFSATMPTWVKKLSTKYLNDALTIDLVGDQGEKLAEGIKLYAIPTIRRSKPTILIDLITVYARGGKTIIFTQTTRGAVEALMALPNNMDSVELHDEIPQHQREIKLQGFREGKIHVIVATDVTSRFLDIPNVDLVIHYELPNDGETFLHRSVRTGRSGKEGTVILMFSIDQRRLLRSFERAVRSKFEFISAPTVEDVSRALAGQVVATLSRVQPKYVEYFIPTAQKLIDEQGTSALAAAIARLTGFSRPPSPRSLISQEQGWVTLQLTCDPDSFKGFLSVKGVKEFLSDVYSKAAERVGNIHLILDERIQGAVFELPEETANELLTKQITPGHYITKITKLPPLQVDGQVKDRSNRNVGSSRGGSRGSSSRGRFSDSDDSRDIFRRSGGGRSRSGNSWSQNSRSSGSDWRASRSPSYGNRDSNRRFEGTCFTCGESGHRSADCPSKRGN